MPITTIRPVDQAAGVRVEQLVRDMPGWQQFRRSDARSAHPTSQGLTARGLGGNASSRALVLLDGVPQTDPFGGWVNWTAFDAVRLAGLQVIRGGGSGGDGVGALAGTVHLVSRAEGREASIAYGSRDSVDADAHWSVRAGTGSIALTGNFSRGDGFIPLVPEQQGSIDEAAAYRSYGLGARFVMPIDARHHDSRVEATVRVFDDRRSRGVPYTGNRNSGLDASLRLVDNGPDASWLALGYLQLRELSSQFSSVNASRSSATPTLDQYDVPATGIGSRVEYRRNLHGSANPLRLGAEWRRTSGETRENFTYVGGRPTRARFAGGETDMFGAYGELGVSLGRVDLALSGRLDRWTIRDGHRREVNIGGSVRSDDRFANRSGWEPTARLSARGLISEGLELKGAVYRGWRLPTLNELYRPFRAGADAVAANELLRPERFHGGELSLTARQGPLSADVTLFRNILRDAIANVTVAMGPGNFPGVGFVGAGGIYRRRDNLPRLETQGIEAGVTVGLEPVQISAGYSYVDAQLERGPLAGKRPAQVPRHSGRFGASWHEAGWKADVTARYLGASYEDDLNLIRLAPALTFDAGVRIEFARRWSFELRGENLANKRVEAAISGAGIIERASPRTFWLGLRYAVD